MGPKKCETDLSTTYGREEGKGWGALACFRSHMPVRAVVRSLHPHLAGLVHLVLPNSRGTPKNFVAARLQLLELTTCSGRLPAVARCALPSTHHAFAVFVAPPASTFRTRRSPTATSVWQVSLVAVKNIFFFLAQPHESPSPRVAVLLVRVPGFLTFQS